MNPTPFPMIATALLLLLCLGCSNEQRGLPVSRFAAAPATDTHRPLRTLADVQAMETALAAEWSIQIARNKQVLLEEFDVNGDGAISEEERQAFLNFLEQFFKSGFDGNGDGQLTSSEQQAWDKSFIKTFLRLRARVDGEGDRDGLISLPEAKRLDTLLSAEMNAPLPPLPDPPLPGFQFKGECKSGRPEKLERDEFKYRYGYGPSVIVGIKGSPVGIGTGAYGKVCHIWELPPGQPLPTSKHWAEVNVAPAGSFLNAAAWGHGEVSAGAQVTVRGPVGPGSTNDNTVPFDTNVGKGAGDPPASNPKPIPHKLDDHFFVTGTVWIVEAEVNAGADLSTEPSGVGTAQAHIYYTLTSIGAH
jgi:hypothetical protein